MPRFRTRVARALGYETPLMRRGRISRSRGLSIERRVATRFRDKGWLVKPSKASRGAYDFLAMRGGRKMLVQVKSGNSPFTREDRSRLRAVAREKGAHAMVYRVSRRRLQPQFV